MMPSQDTKKLADKIAKILETEPQGADLAALYASIEKLNHRLEKVEAAQNPHSAKLPSLSEEGWPKAGVVNPQLIHPSLEKFDVAEAIADEIFVGIHKEKACTFEPNGKPCDHCAMCSSRGF